MIRVLVDTNIAISTLLFPNSTPARALALVLDEHRLVLTDWIIDDLHEVSGASVPICWRRWTPFWPVSTTNSPAPVIRVFRSVIRMTSRSSTLPWPAPSTSS